ncbi:hypothetical protein Cgig2_013365 [Carnegiea gigantea]|uniref:Topo IIA-type catalytic domain-containing protein n=1 Tax=Carnegiea gigantea TaxID=171969 RepID=A0A9Q1K8K3_9CARY|nr:hypothetical protein Cgig2_013365 [Carnegiea gigantea]
MAVSTGVGARLFRCCNHRLLLRPPRFLNLSELRFFSDTSSRRPQRLKAKRGDESEGKDGNGSVVSFNLKERDVGVERIVPTELHKEATEAYMAYAMSVLLGRALPDIRDGLKPVHRRIIYAMHELGLSSRKPFKKCARVVGEVLGKFHPHGDSAVYESLVRMAQIDFFYPSPLFSPKKGRGVFVEFYNEDFSLRNPLIQGHGNFGSIDADPPAAMRYTECRLEVDFVPNFDNSQKEPSLLPARVPNLLLNGSSGIAVGMATTIPPHNLGELVDALSVLIRNPEATCRVPGQEPCHVPAPALLTLQELLEFMPAPDFPTGGLIMGNDGILEAYRTGRGRIVMRGKTDLELLDSKTKRSAIIIKEIPYQTNKAALVEKIAELVENKVLLSCVKC